MGGVYLQNVAGHQPVKKHAQRGQVLLDGGRGARSLQVLDEGGDVEGLNVGEPGDAAALAPGVKTPRGAQVGPAGVVVVDLGGEKLQDAPGGLGGRGEQGRGLKRACRREDESGARRDSLSVEAGVAHARGLPLGVILECDKGSYHTLNRRRKPFPAHRTSDPATRGSVPVLSTI